MSYWPIEKSTRGRTLSDEIYAVVYRAIDKRPKRSARIVQSTVGYADTNPAAGAHEHAFTDLIDTFTAYTGLALEFVRVNAGETGLETAAIPTGVTLVREASTGDATRLGGDIDSLNTTYTTTEAYKTGTLMVFLNGLLQIRGAGNDWTETSAAAGTFDFVAAPDTGDIISTLYEEDV